MPEPLLFPACLSKAPKDTKKYQLTNAKLVQILFNKNGSVNHMIAQKAISLIF
jgi:hypothetical protein